jgi:hypothetical protein
MRARARVRTDLQQARELAVAVGDVARLAGALDERGDDVAERRE